MANMSELLSDARKENEQLKAQLFEKSQLVEELQQRIMDMKLHGATDKQSKEVNDGITRS